MKRGIAFAMVVAAFALPAAASAATECVPNISIPNCPASAANEPTIATAVTNATSGDTIVIGPGTFNESVNDGGTKALHFVGEGEAQTTIQGQGSPAMTVSSGSSVTGLTVNLHDEQGGIGLSLAGTATNVAVTATGPNNTTNPLGLELTGGATFSHGSITLPLSGTEVDHYAGVIGSGTVADSSITAPVGVGTDGSAASPTVTRDRIVANEGVLVGATGATIEDSLIATVPGAAPELGIGFDPASVAFGTFSVRHDTIIGGSSPSSVGVELSASTPALPATSSATIESSVVRGYATSVSAVAISSSPAWPASATVTIDHSFYDPATAKTQETGPGPATATITPDATSGNHDPLFVNTAAGDYRLQAGSPAIDAGETAVASGESMTDLVGNPRATIGHNGVPATTDIGAYEFQPHAPTATALVGSSAITLGQPVTFAATGGDASPGDSVAFTWSFDDGSNGAGALVTHIFTAPGVHTGTVTVTDLDGFTATAQATVTVTGSGSVPKPTLTKLRIKPAKLRNGQKAKISYVDSQPGTVAFTVQRFKKHHRFLRVGAFRHKSVAGPNHLTFRVRHRLPGRYRIVAIPRDTAGTGSAVSVRFQVKA